MSANSCRYRNEHNTKREDHLRVMKLHTDDRYRLLGSVRAAEHKTNIIARLLCRKQVVAWEALTLLLCDGQRQEGDKGCHGEDTEEQADADKELEAFEPCAPVVLKVHDVCDQSPERQHACQTQQCILNLNGIGFVLCYFTTTVICL